jgi:hypothetical protein
MKTSPRLVTFSTGKRGSPLARTSQNIPGNGNKSLTRGFVSPVGNECYAGGNSNNSVTRGFVGPEVLVGC